MFCLWIVAFKCLEYLFGDLHDLDLLLAIPLFFPLNLLCLDGCLEALLLIL